MESLPTAKGFVIWISSAMQAAFYHSVTHKPPDYKNTRFLRRSLLFKLVSQEIDFCNFNSVFATFHCCIRHISRHILTGIKIALKMYSYINPIIYSEIQKLSLIIAFAPEFFYQILKFCYRHSTIHFAPIFLLKEHHFMH